MQRRLRLAQEQILAQAYMERFEKAIKTPDFEAHAREVYKADEPRFVVPEQVQLKHILVNFQGRTEEGARLRAEEARAKLVAGENFNRVAREYSNDPNFRSNDGVYQGSYQLFEPAIAEAAHTLELDQPSPLIRTASGYHVIVVESRAPAKVTPFEKAKRGLIEADQAKYRKEFVDKKLGSITQLKDVVVYTDAIAALTTQLDREQLSRLHEEQSRKDIEEKRRLRGEASKPAGQ
jgi:peptidyl-prolyl cis-trans isomerase C